MCTFDCACPSTFVCTLQVLYDHRSSGSAKARSSRILGLVLFCFISLGFEFGLNFTCGGLWSDDVCR